MDGLVFIIGVFAGLAVAGAMVMVYWLGKRSAGAQKATPAAVPAPKQQPAPLPALPKPAPAPAPLPPTAVCPNCGRTNRAVAKICAGCGKKMVRSCQKCGTDNVPGAKFCKKCGMKL